MPGVAKPELKSALAETKPSLPEVAPVASAVKNSVRCPCYETFFFFFVVDDVKLKQGTLTEGEGSVRSTSSLGLLVLLYSNNVFSINSSLSKLVITRRSTLLSLPFGEDSLAKVFVSGRYL